MPYDSDDDFKVVLGYFKDGKFVEVPFEDVEFVDDAEEEEEDINPFSTLAKFYYDIYSAFIEMGFEKNHAFSFTRDVVNDLKRSF